MFRKIPGNVLQISCIYQILYCEASYCSRVYTGDQQRLVVIFQITVSDMGSQEVENFRDQVAIKMADPPWNYNTTLVSGIRVCIHHLIDRVCCLCIFYWGVNCIVLQTCLMTAVV